MCSVFYITIGYFKMYVQHKDNNSFSKFMCKGDGVLKKLLSLHSLKRRCERE